MFNQYDILHRSGYNWPFACLSAINIPSIAKIKISLSNLAKTLEDRAHLLVRRMRQIDQRVRLQWNMNAIVFTIKEVWRQCNYTRASVQEWVKSVTPTHCCNITKYNFLFFQVLSFSYNRNCKCRIIRLLLFRICCFRPIKWFRKQVLHFVFTFFHCIIMRDSLSLL